jgi:hypothetical protein
MSVSQKKSSSWCCCCVLLVVGVVVPLRIGLVCVCGGVSLAVAGGESVPVSPRPGSAFARLLPNPGDSLLRRCGGGSGSASGGCLVRWRAEGPEEARHDPVRVLERPDSEAREPRAAEEDVGGQPAGGVARECARDELKELGGEEAGEVGRNRNFRGLHDRLSHLQSGKRQGGAGRR